MDKGEKQIPVPDILRSRDYRDFSVDEVNVFKQIRPSRSPEFDNMVRSIASSEGGLINELDGAVLSEGLIEQYQDFVWQTWGKPENPKPLVPISSYPDLAGMYLLLIAGEQRFGAIQIVRQLHERNYLIPFRLHRISNIGQIITIQADENIHVQPPEDRVARVIAELFIHEKLANPKLTKSGFRKRNGITENTLEKALCYVELPQWAREQITAETVPFSVAVEISRSIPTLRLFRMLKMTGKTQPESLSDQEQAAVQKELDDDIRHSLCHFTQTANRRTMRALEILRAHRKNFESLLADLLDQEGIRPKAALTLEIVDFSTLSAETRRREISQLLRDFRIEHGLGAIALANTIAGAVGESKVSTQQQEYAQQAMDLAEQYKTSSRVRS